jgi:REP element-mobilizing transposase RayT
MRENPLTDADYEYIHRGTREKRHRLSRESYVGYTTVVFTICGTPRCCNLAANDVFRALCTWLKEACSKHDTELLALTVMSDHLHAVLRGVASDADLWAAISLFKQKAGFHGKRFTGFRLQKDFYDHVIRKDEDVSKHFYYVLSNP